MPSYFIVGGLVFVPLSIPFLEHAYGGAPTRIPTSPGLCMSLHAPLIAEQPFQPAPKHQRTSVTALESSRSMYTYSTQLFCTDIVHSLDVSYGVQYVDHRGASKEYRPRALIVTGVVRGCAAEILLVH